MQTLPDIREVPLISLTERQTASGKHEHQPESWSMTGLPLFWGETKSTEFWMKMLKALNVGQVLETWYVQFKVLFVIVCCISVMN